MIVKVSRSGAVREKFTSPIASIKTVKVVKASQPQEQTEPEKPSVLERVAKMRPLTERHARLALSLLFIS